MRARVLGNGLPWIAARQGRLALPPGEWQGWFCVVALVGARGKLDRMSPHEQLQKMLKGPEPILALAPMMDVTTPGFWKLLAAHGNADLYVTGYMRVHSSSTLTKRMLKPIVENPTGRPVLAQIIGNDIPSLVRMAQELQEYPIAGIDLNLGCPAPIVYRKCAGSGLLRHPEKIDAILAGVAGGGADQLHGQNTDWI